ncbi:hypothetical protein chiPu_0018973 [Chiloscyllium punctatum]|uniref:Uncharacterized protein n=1 Tax=Chiloscyllium punctatum TaxID=137246 RepID=A0A401RQI0_CHIPU|nr:hypothetical protein [Chiloscyllium punctatum]
MPDRLPAAQRRSRDIGAGLNSEHFSQEPAARPFLLPRGRGAWGLAPGGLARSRGLGLGAAADNPELPVTGNTSPAPGRVASRDPGRGACACAPAGRGPRACVRAAGHVAARCRRAE